MKDFLKNNFIVIISLLLPVIFILGVVLFINFPRSLPTDYDFVYAVCEGGNYRVLASCNDFLRKKYYLEDGRLEINEGPINEANWEDKIIDLNEVYKSHLILHDSKANKSLEITLAEAQSLILQDSITSPDGATINPDYYYYKNDFLFFDQRSSRYENHLKKGNQSVRLNLINSNTNTRDLSRDFRLIGWVLPQ